MKCHTNVNSTPPTQLPLKFSYIVAILIHNHLESPNIITCMVRRIVFLLFVSFSLIDHVLINSEISFYTAIPRSDLFKMTFR
jgi:hypothetical protein